MGGPMDKFLEEYQNGNVLVTIFDDGTKVREYLDPNSINIVHPESIDIKITNYCDLGCVYCHEESTTKGSHGYLEELAGVLSELPSGVELAIGGGNPLSHPDLVPFLQYCKSKGFIANITVNQGHLKTYYDLIHDLITKDLIKGIGISITSNNWTWVKNVKELSNNVVYHVIAGVNNPQILNELLAIDKKNCKVLVLGYKDFGFGTKYFSEHNKKVDSNLLDWYHKIPNYFGEMTLAFDNLAIEQLNIKSRLSKEKWDTFYMGDDFTFTMYIDAVKKEFSPTSRTLKNRESWGNVSLLDYFQIMKDPAKLND